MIDFALLIETLGPTGAILAIGVMAARSLMPLFVAGVGHLGKIADAMQQTAMAVAVVDKKIDQQEANIERQLGEIRQQSAENGEDLAGLYALLSAERASKRRPRAAAGD